MAESGGGMSPSMQVIVLILGIGAIGTCAMLAIFFATCLCCTKSPLHFCRAACCCCCCCGDGSGGGGVPIPRDGDTRTEYDDEDEDEDVDADTDTV
jgi:hypothetical protein